MKPIPFLKILEFRKKSSKVVLDAMHSKITILTNEIQELQKLLVKKKKAKTLLLKQSREFQIQSVIKNGGVTKIPEGKHGKKFKSYSALELGKYVPTLSSEDKEALKKQLSKR